MISVAFDMTFPNRNAAGSGVYARELLAELQRRPEISVTPVAGRQGGISSTLGWLTAGARRATANAQVVHCPAFIAPWRLAAPFVLTVHDTSLRRFPEGQPLEWRTYSRWLLPERVRSAARVITGSEATRRDIVRDFGISPERIAVTPYGVSDRFAPQDSGSRSVGDPPKLLFAGAPVKRKNLALVLRAMAESPAESRMKLARLTITGATSEQYPQYRDLVRTLGLADRIEWCGGVNADAMPALMAGCDLLVYPSWYEGFGFPPLEAMRAGVPVVASNVSSLPEVLGDAALLVDPGDTRAFTEAVEATLTRTDLRRDLISKGRSRAARFTWSRCADLTVEVYREAVKLSPAVRG